MVRESGRAWPSQEGQSALEHHRVQRTHCHDGGETRGVVAASFNVAGTQGVLDEHDRRGLGYDRSIPFGVHEVYRRQRLHQLPNQGVLYQSPTGHNEIHGRLLGAKRRFTRH